MNLKLVANKDYVAGWLDSSLHDFLAVLPADGESIKYALITSIDSNPKPASMRLQSPELKRIANKLEPLGDALLMTTKALVESDARKQILFGFDEIYFFPERSITPKPKSASLIGPARLSRARFNRIAKWMSANSCSLALGSGVGLNFIVRAHGLVRFLLGHTLEQSEASAA
jgi:hypothetical protein